MQVFITTVPLAQNALLSATSCTRVFFDGRDKRRCTFEISPGVDYLLLRGKAFAFNRTEYFPDTCTFLYCLTFYLILKLIYLRKKRERKRGCFLIKRVEI